MTPAVNKQDVIKLLCHLLHWAASNRTIPKQQCMLLLGNLNLVMCSEIIQMSSGQCKQPCMTMLQWYKKRAASLSHFTLNQLFQHIKKTAMVGVRRQWSLTMWVAEVSAWRCTVCSSNKTDIYNNSVVLCGWQKSTSLPSQKKVCKSHVYNSYSMAGTRTRTPFPNDATVIREFDRFLKT